MKMLPTERYANDDIMSVVLKNDEERVMYELIHAYPDDVLVLVERIPVKGGKCQVNTTLKL
ncbi:hypothetical protein M1M34_gp123 [Haloarcula tailed virus 2]|uniref:Uncharacterized protein n=1 Tax=Haloarcula tailed virus 2 TaxID=2877989 RepID=A0AAE8XZW2_9CAUD|nr:hypothetical protein M1M34_gp123 [Haloarcula tailed virus 2]UBF23210.1 hypothetical protein HATV-2_gp59 [Haloarcula tailed virus 2]